MMWIAEIGLNHQGSMDKAKRMISKARDAGADIAKFQYYSPIEVLGPNSPYIDYANQCFFTRVQHEELKQHCDAVGIEYCVSVFATRDIEWAGSLCQTMKIATRMNKNRRFIEQVERLGKPVVMSIQEFHQERKNPLTTHLWCIAKYPSTREEVLSYEFDERHGLSSHCPDWQASLEAAKRGAPVIENHVCEAMNETGCDIPASLDFADYKRLINASRD